jgi:hypothetical protein
VHLFFTADHVSMLFVVMVARPETRSWQVDSPHDGGCVLFCLGGG